MKKLNTLLAVLVLAVVLATPALAAIEVSGSAYVGYFDKYLWRGIDLSGGSPVVQGGVNLSTSGFTLSYWTNIQTKDDEITYFDPAVTVEGGNATETDITIDYTFSPIDKLKVSVGNIWYALEGVDTKEAYLGLALDVPLAPVVKAYYDYDQSEENGLFYTAAVSHSFSPMDKLNLGFGALVSYNDENWGVSEEYSDWHNYELTASATYAITDQIAIIPSVLYSSPISDEAKDAIDSEWLGGLTVSMSF